ncbi:hypothetical protein CerSpe_145260 [Prunus speciosa]
MAFHYCLLGVLMPLSLLIAQAAAITEGPQLALPNCPDHCGNLTIPYPFGVKENCYLSSSFFISCTRDESREPQWKPYWGNIIVSNISLEEAELQILNFVAKDCYNKQGNQTYNIWPLLSLSPSFTIFHAKNKFFAVSCNTLSKFFGYRPNDQKITWPGVCPHVTALTALNIRTLVPELGAAKLTSPVG